MLDGKLGGLLEGRLEVDGLSDGDRLVEGSLDGLVAGMLEGSLEGMLEGSLDGI